MIEDNIEARSLFSNFFELQIFRERYEGSLAATAARAADRWRFGKATWPHQQNLKWIKHIKVG